MKGRTGGVGLGGSDERLDWGDQTKGWTRGIGRGARLGRSDEVVDKFFLDLTSFC